MEYLETNVAVEHIVPYSVFIIIKLNAVLEPKRNVARDKYSVLKKIINSELIIFVLYYLDE